MKPSSRHVAQALLLSTITFAAMGQSTPATWPYTIGPDTTLVSGPLNPDGTINYVQVINDRLSAGVTPENNAAIPLLEATTNAANEAFVIRAARALSVHLDEASALNSLEKYAAQKKGSPLSADEADALEKAEDRCLARPWKATEFPSIAEWLAHSEKAFVLLEGVCRKDRCYVPWVSKSSPPNWYDAIPSLAMFRGAGEAFLIRAMRRAGEGHLVDALADIRRARVLARLCVQQRTDISMLVAVAIEMMALHGYEGLATSGLLDEAALKTVRQEINALPPLPSLVEANDLEELIALDMAMSCIRGDGQHVMRAAAGIFDQNTPINLGDLSKVDWDELLKAVQRESRNNNKIDALPFDKRMKAAEKLSKAAIAEKIPGTVLFTGDQAMGMKAVETFLRMRDGESRADFADRIAHWWVAGWPDLDKRLYEMVERGSLERGIALMTISLADYRLAHGEYPGTLKALGEPVMRDPFSGGEMVYRREEKGYVLYSVGINQKDDGGTGDDRPVRAEK